MTSLQTRACYSSDARGRGESIERFRARCRVPLLHNQWVCWSVIGANRYRPDLGRYPTMAELHDELEQVVNFWLANSSIRLEDEATYLRIVTEPLESLPTKTSEGTKTEPVRLVRFANYQDAKRSGCSTGMMTLAGSVKQPSKPVRFLVYFRYDGPKRTIAWPAYKDLARENMWATLARLYGMRWIWCPSGADWLVKSMYHVVNASSGKPAKPPAPPPAPSYSLKNLYRSVDPSQTWTGVAVAAGLVIVAGVIVGTSITRTIGTS